MWDASKCNFCGDCLTKCLYVDYDKNKAVADIKLLMEGKDAGILHKCITCCACSEYCPTGADPFDLILKMMEKTKSFPVGPELINGFKLTPTIPNQVIPGDADKPLLSLCVMQFPDGALDGQMFKGMPVAKGGDYFCYLGWVHVGMESPLPQNAKKFIDNLAALGKDIVFIHDDCYAMIDAKVKDYGIKVPFKYMHVLEYMRNYLRDNPSKITRLNKKVAYQRPCASRLTPDKDKFVDEIFQLIGVERPARKYERETALCCSAAIVRVYPEVAADIQTKNVDDSIKAGADAIVTLCPMCDRVLRRPTTEKGIKKIYITDLCRMALGEKPFPD
ncbi:MAG: (Fe-S)-binding protein [Dehalococcoidia bacterium]|nr:(Fe-S)-binding protein [Dehalococcoidia bacterium]